MSNPDRAPGPTTGNNLLGSVQEAAYSPRLMSLDALRGFDMFWIIGAEDMVHALHGASRSGPVEFLTAQLSHKPWAGVVFYDLIFPLFVFIVGISLVFSLTRTVAREGPAAACRRILTRGLLLYALGLFYYGGLSKGWDQVRLLGVLQRIAICYTVAGLLFVTLRLRTLVAVCAAILLGYWALMAWTPIRDINLERKNVTSLMAQTGMNDVETLYRGTTNRVTGVYEDGRNVAHHADFLYLPARKWDGAYDPEGLLSTLPAIGTCLLGVFAGLWLRNGAFDDRAKVRWLAAAGLAGVCVGYLWGLQFPVIKKIWTSSYVLVAAGYSCLLLAAFHQVIEVWNVRKWAVPFVWIGMNPLTLYLIAKLVDLNAIVSRVVGGPVKDACGAYGPVVNTLAILGLMFWIAHFLHKRKIFLRL